MSRNGAGLYSLPAGSTVANGDTSDASDVNTPIADLAADNNVARPIVAGGTGAASASAARTNLGLAIGTDVQAFNANLSSLAGLTLEANKGLYSTAADTVALFDLTAAGRALLDDADAAAQRTTLGLGGLATLDILDEDDFATDSATRPPSQQSVKAYVDGVGSVKAWVNFNGSGTVAIRESHNVTSVNDGGTGSYSVTMTEAMPDANYAVIASASAANVWVSASTASVINVTVVNSAGAAVDDPIISIAVIR